MPMLGETGSEIGSGDVIDFVAGRRHLCSKTPHRGQHEMQTLPVVRLGRYVCPALDHEDPGVVGRTTDQAGAPAIELISENPDSVHMLILRAGDEQWAECTKQEQPAHSPQPGSNPIRAN